MRGPEGVVDIDVRVGRELGRELRIVGLLLGVEAEVLEEQDLTGPQALTASSVPSPRASPVTGTFRRSSSPRRMPTGRRRRLSETLPSGRPRWLASTTRAPAWSRVRMVADGGAVGNRPGPCRPRAAR